jgi:hypothetical protein
VSEAGHRLDPARPASLRMRGAALRVCVCVRACVRVRVRVTTQKEGGMAAAPSRTRVDGPYRAQAAASK